MTRKAVGLIAITMLATGIAKAPASADTQIVPAMVSITEEAPGVRSARWGTATALDGALHFDGLQLVLLKDSARLSYLARVSRLGPADSAIRVELFAGSKSVGTLNFGQWNRNCSTRHEQRRAIDATVGFSSLNEVDKARMYITGNSWTGC